MRVLGGIVLALLRGCQTPAQYWIKFLHPWVQKFYPVLGLGSGERLLWHFQTPVLYWIKFQSASWGDFRWGDFWEVRGFPFCSGKEGFWDSLLRSIHIELLFRNAPAKSSWTALSLVWFAGATPDCFKGCLFRHYSTTIAQLSPLSGLERGGWELLPGR